MKPGIDGVEIAECIKKLDGKFAALPIIIVSVEAEKETVIRALAIDVNNMLLNLLPRVYPGKDANNLEKTTSATIIKNISVICPYRNEEQILPVFRPIVEDLAFHGAEIIFINSRSEDKSKSIVDSWQFPKKSLNLNGQTASIGQAILEASYHSSKEFIVILPVDIWLYADQLIDLENYLQNNEKLQWGAFYKEFGSLKWHYRLYSWIQNEIRLKILRRAVWTNVLFARKHHIIRFLSNPQGFMEDTQLSDSLHDYDFVALARRPVIVSERKFKSSAKFQMIKNVIILVLYRTKIFSLETLRKIYNY